MINRNINNRVSPTEENKDISAYVLGDEIGSIRDKAFKINIILNDLMERFFTKYDLKNQADISLMIYNFNKMSMYADMASTLSYEAMKEISELETKGTEYLKSISEKAC